MIEKTGNRPNTSESLAKAEGVTVVAGVTSSTDESFVRARARGRARARTRSRLEGNTGNSGNNVDNTPSSKRETPVTTHPDPPGNAGNGLFVAPADLDAALRLPVAHLPALPAALTYRLSHELGPVAWTTSPGAYGALRGSWAAFSPIEFVAAVEGGQGGAIGAATFAAWVSCKLADGEWRLDTRTARGGLPGRVECEKWWPGTDWCAGHWITPEHGWTVGLACAYFRLTPVSVELHAPPAQEAA